MSICGGPVPAGRHSCSCTAPAATSGRCKPVADRIAPAAPVSRRGTVVEDDLTSRTDDLAAFLPAAAARYGVAAGSWVPVGFSNGANLAAALLVRHPADVAGAVLIAAMPPSRNPRPPSTSAGGASQLRDRVTHPACSRDLAAELRRCGAEVAELAHKGGHVVPDAVLPELRGSSQTSPSRRGDPAATPGHDNPAARTTPRSS